MSNTCSVSSEKGTSGWCKGFDDYKHSRRSITDLLILSVLLALSLALHK